MVLTAIDGFDLYNGIGANTGAQTKWALNDSAFMSMQAGRFGGQCLQISGVSGGAGNPQATRLLTSATRTSGINGVAMRWTQWPNDYRALNSFGLMQAGGGTYQFGVHVNVNGGMEVYRLSGYGTGTQLGATVTGLIPLNTWQYLEIIWTCSSTVGSVQLYLEGVSVLNLTGVNNQNAGTPTCDSFRAEVFQGSNGILQFDDYIEGDGTTTMGPLRVETVRGASDAAVQWSPLTGTTNFNQINETVCDGDTTYVQATNVGNRDRYNFGSLSTSPASIAGVNAVSFAEKTDVTLRQIYHSVRSGATDSDGTAFNLSGAYGKFERLMTTDPNTSAAWTPAAVNSLTGGPKLAA